MIEIKGKYTSAVVFCDTLEAAAEGQIRTLCDQPFARGAAVRVMPDVHAGKGCTIGTTMPVRDAVVPNLVGVDIGCGMETVLLRSKRVNLPELDSFVRQNIPAGREIRSAAHKRCGEVRLEELRCFEKVDLRRGLLSLGTLGGGNHFIEVARDAESEELFLVIHSGSRHPGLRVAEYYQKLAFEACGGRGQAEIPFELAFLEGQLLEDYLHDMSIMQRYALLNRQIMVEVILGGMKLRDDGSFSTIHNYIENVSGIFRKGAVSAKAGETLLIPINMRDGSLICTGLGNPDWNLSAPHGAGRLMSRRAAAEAFTVSAYKKEMEGIFSSTVSKETLDECPMAYKPMEEIVANISPTARIDRVIKPIYNFKASEK